MRTLLILLALYQGANGLFMLAAPEVWYGLVPGVEHTGPLNVHFVRDIGLAFLAAATGLAMAAAGAGRAALWPAAAFLSGHAGLHIAEMAVHGTNAADALRDTVLILIPGLAPLALALTPRTSRKEIAT